MVEIKSVQEKDLPLVSIVIVTYNGSAYIKNLLDSLQYQSYPQNKTDIIIVDNASSDNTTDIVKECYPFSRLFILPHNIGFAAGCNYVLQHVSTEYIVFLNQDTICHKDWLKGLVNTMINDTKIGSCTSNMIFINPDSSSSPDLHNPPKTLCWYDLNCFGFAYYRCCEKSTKVFTKIISGCSFIIRKEIINELGGLFDDDLWMYVEDTDLSLRIHNIGYKTVAVKESVVYHIHKTTLSINSHRFNIAATALKNRLYVFYKNMTSLEFILFYPFLLIGGIFKIFSIQIKTLQKIVYFIPFSLFSICCMVMATFNLYKFKEKKCAILKNRRIKTFGILKLLLSKNP